VKRAGERDEELQRKDFLAETDGLLEESRDALADLAKAGGEPPPNAINALFRAIHSLKGLSALTGFSGLAGFAHEVEGLLDSMRMGRIDLSDELLEVVEEALDVIAAAAVLIQAGEADPEVPQEAATRIRRTVASGRSREVADDGSGPRLPPDVDRMLTDYERHRLRESVRRGRLLAFFTLELPLDSFDTGLRKAMDEVARSGELIGTFPGGGGGDPTRMVFRLLGGIPPETPLEVVASLAGASSSELLEGRGPDLQGEPEVPPPGIANLPAPPFPTQMPPSIRATGGTVRVPLEKLGQLVNLTGELAFSRSALKRSLGRVLASATDRTARFEAQKAFADLDRTVTALGRAALATRFVPVGQLTARLSRVVASVAPSLGKELTFDVYGGETEVDKVLAEELVDPLLHIVRNALDHGIEPPGEREARGKPRAGRLTLVVETRGRMVVFTVADDGRGMQGETLVRRAREKGLLSPFEPDPPDPLELVFLPGFSTTERVTEVSGRGVGLDVVRANLAKLKGNVRVTSTPGRGTTFVVQVPMTLVLVESLLVRTGGFYLALPTSGVRRAFRADPARIERRGETVVIEDEGEPLPLFSLATHLGLETVGAAMDETVVVVEQGSLRAGFTVSSIEGMEDVIVKPLADVIPRSREVTGAAELPGGSVALTVDLGLLLESALPRGRSTGELK
jgi:two-component system, chemotaxis family, sensor kinase CheA